MHRKVGILLAFFAVLSVARLPLGIVQVGAWVDRFNEFVEQTGSVKTSVNWTLDGEHLCATCEFVSEQAGEAEDEESSSAVESSSAKIPLAPLSAEVIVVEPSRVTGMVVAEERRCSTRVSDIEVPPPRNT